MKKIGLLCLCLMLALALGCKAAAPAETTPGEDPSAEDPTVITVVPPEEGTPLVQLESLDYDEASQQILVNFTRMTFIPAPEGAPDTDYQIVDDESEPEQLKLSKNATVDFPMRDDFAKTVTLTAEELPQEYADHMAEHEGATLLFTMTEAGGEILSLRHFYTP